MKCKGGSRKFDPPFPFSTQDHSLRNIVKKSSQKTPLQMTTPLLILLDPHQFSLLQTLQSCEVVNIGNDFVHESEAVIFHEYLHDFDELTGKVCIRKGWFKEIQYSNIFGTNILLLGGYTIEGVRVPLGLSGVRSSDKLESF